MLQYFQRAATDDIGSGILKFFQRAITPGNTYRPYAMCPRCKDIVLPVAHHDRLIRRQPLRLQQFVQQIGLVVEPSTQFIPPHIGEVGIERKMLDDPSGNPVELFQPKH